MGDRHLSGRRGFSSPVAILICRLVLLTSMSLLLTSVGSADLGRTTERIRNPIRRFSQVGVASLVVVDVPSHSSQPLSLVNHAFINACRPLNSRLSRSRFALQVVQPLMTNPCVGGQATDVTTFSQISRYIGPVASEICGVGKGFHRSPRWVDRVHHYDNHT